MKIISEKKTFYETKLISIFGLFLISNRIFVFLDCYILENNSQYFADASAENNFA